METLAIVTSNKTFGAELKAKLQGSNYQVKIFDASTSEGIEVLYKNEVRVAIVDYRLASLPMAAWHDLLAGFSKRVKIFVLHDATAPIVSLTSRPLTRITWLRSNSPTEIDQMVADVRTINHRKPPGQKDIPIYEPQVAVRMLKQQGALGVLVVDASKFRKIAIEYGVEVYHKICDEFQKILLNLWGTQGNFRNADILCRQSEHGNIYYVLLSGARSDSSLPVPGVLERLADRLALTVHKKLWQCLSTAPVNKLFPATISSIPDFMVGHATALYNPCVDPVETCDRLLDAGLDMARILVKRTHDRQRELITSLILANDVLHPHYQAVFHLAGITKKAVEEAKSKKSIRPLEKQLFGFESLIRLRAEAMGPWLYGESPLIPEVSYLRPDVLFAIAKSAKVGLELDQACLRLGIEFGKDLPGSLMVNILPRNLYHVDRLDHLFDGRRQILFEVSESEAITNMDLLLRIRHGLQGTNRGVATDDFGSGHGGFERVLQIKPDMIKLDRSLIQDIHQDETKQSFIKGFTKTARTVNATVLAEGVEDWEEARVLQELGVDFVQGFLLHRPQAVKDILADLQEKQELDDVA